MMSRLQKHNFQWEDEPYEILAKKYPKCTGALKWWCNEYDGDRFNIKRNRFLKEFILANPPTFKISNKCCNFAKKDVIHNCIKEGQYDLNISGVRKSEGGIRSISYKNCYDQNNQGVDKLRPIFWIKNEDKINYENFYNIVHSKCYTDYGFTRTGCCCCPYGKDFEKELEVVEKYEPKLAKAVKNIFKDSYEYTRQYREFCKEKKCTK